MNKHDPLTSSELNQFSDLLPIIALFENNFSIDWLVELTKSKPSTILTLLEELTKGRWLKRKQNGYYCLSNMKMKEEIKELSAEEQIYFHERISEILMADAIEENSKTKTLYFHLQHIPADFNRCCWLKNAGDLFLKDHDTDKALACYLKIIEYLSSVDGADANKLFIETALRYAKISLAKEKTSKVLFTLQTALSMAIRLGLPDKEALLKMNMADYEWFLGRDEKAIRYFEDGLKKAEKLDDPHVLNTINLFKTYFYFRQGRFRDVIDWYERFVPEITKFPEGLFPLVSVTLAGYSYGHMGQFAQAIGVLDALRYHTKKMGDSLIESYAVSTLGMLLIDVGKNEEARDVLEYGMESSTRIANHWAQTGCALALALCYYRLGNNSQAVAFRNRYVDFTTQFQFEQLFQPHLMELCWAAEEGKLPAANCLSVKEEIHKALSTSNLFLKGVAYRYQALLARRREANHENIIKSLNLSVTALNESGSIIELAKTKMELTRQYLLVGDDELAAQTGKAAFQILSPINKDLIADDIKHLCCVEGETEGLLLNEILTLGHDIVNIRESRDLVMRFISSGNRLTGAERGALFLKDSEGKLTLKASKNISLEQMSQATFSESMSIIEEVAKTGKGIIKGIKGNEKAILGQDIRSIISVPMMLRNELKGVIYHDNILLGSVFKESDLDLLAFFAALATIALDNVQYYEKFQEANQRLSEEKRYFEEQYLGEISDINIVGNSTGIKRVLHQVKQVAESNTNVLIMGDTGVGKELVARAIHRDSLRKDKPFICVQCSALPEHLLSSELFGHEKGAFTGAIQRKFGRFELANGGTLFLDEMGELSMEMQVHLLRVLETKQFERIGGIVTIHSDFRLVAATNRDLKKEVEAGRFRKDLYYRLNVFPIYVPSLKERKKDIPLFIDYFARSFAKKLGKAFDRISQEDANRLLDYDWPGNVRELQNLVERAIIIHQGSTLRFPGLMTIRDSHEAPIRENASENMPSLSLRENVRDSERQLIIEALQKTNWKVSGPRSAANLLSIHPSTLIFRMKKLGIKRLD